MPFCTQCGNPVDPSASFCAGCGARQPGGPPPKVEPNVAPGEEYLRTVTPSTASILCYIPFVGWVAALVFLSSQRFKYDNTVRFHAFQGMYLAVAWLIVDIAIGVFIGIAGVAARRAITGSLKLSILCGWIYMIYKTSMGEFVRLPFLGELAERSVAEQSSGRP